MGGILAGFGALAQSRAAFKARQEIELQLHYETLLRAHEREQERIRKANRGRTWKCGPWTWET